MAHLASESLVRQLGSLFEGGSVAGLSDRQLLERFTTGERDAVGEAAFAALVAGTGPWSWTSAGNFWATTTMPRTPSRPSSWSGSQSPVDPRPRPAGQLALWGRSPHGPMHTARSSPDGARERRATR